MDDDGFYHRGSRGLQDAFDTRRIADRLHERLGRTELTQGDRDFIGRCSMFFLATADDRGRPDCSYKGGAPGFVKVVGPSELAFPDYDGNGMFRSLGNVEVNPHVAMLFIDFERPMRLRINGTARVHRQDPLLADFVGAQMVVRVHAERIFPNCPRYVHRMQRVEESPYVPVAGKQAPRPAWKDMEALRDALPERDKVEREPE